MLNLPRTDIILNSPLCSIVVEGEGMELNFIAPSITYWKKRKKRCKEKKRIMKKRKEERKMMIIRKTEKREVMRNDKKSWVERNRKE